METQLMRPDEGMLDHHQEINIDGEMSLRCHHPPFGQADEDVLERLVLASSLVRLEWTRDMRSAHHRRRPEEAPSSMRASASLTGSRLSVDRVSPESGGSGGSELNGAGAARGASTSLLSVAGDDMSSHAPGLRPGEPLFAEEDVSGAWKGWVEIQAYKGSA